MFSKEPQTLQKCKKMKTAGQNSWYLRRNVPGIQNERATLDQVSN